MNSPIINNSSYRGRFAPSPSGPLHFGSLVAALGSWLDAKHQNGQWLVRIEDIDPPREVKGASDLILSTLEAHGLYWDEQVTYQSNNVQHYQDIIDRLLDSRLAYRCICTRKMIQSTGGVYQNTCRNKHHPRETEHSIRLKVMQPSLEFIDLFLGHYKIDSDSSCSDPKISDSSCSDPNILSCSDPNILSEDFVIKRKDGLYAYMLAVVVDDHQQQISHVIRGADLLETTLHQMTLFNILGYQTPLYGHLPVAINAEGLKLSKQNHAAALANNQVSENLFQALEFLQQSPPKQLAGEPKQTILQWAIENWQPTAFSKQREITIGG